jgi:hypothetical protein
LFGLAAVVAGCYNQPGADEESSVGTETSGASTDGPSTGSGPQTGGSTADSTAGSSGGEAVCGDGEVTGDEICDDGINDGGYGSCLPDCSALGEHCGDGVLNGPEACDNGDANANGAGCNLDCVVSGSVVGTWELTNLGFTDSIFVTKPAFRANGNALVAATGVGSDDPQVFVELTSDVGLDRMFDPPVTDFVVYQGTLVGDAWVLATPTCNLAISNAGQLTEVCEDRIRGSVVLEGIDDQSYLAAETSEIAQFGAGSPATGDTPDWIATPDVDPGSFNDAALGIGNLIGVVGYQYDSDTSTYFGLIGRYASDGAPQGTVLVDAVDFINHVAPTPDEGWIATADLFASGETNLLRFDADLDVVWNKPVATDTSASALAVDSAADVVIAVRDPGGSGNYSVRKLAPDGQTERWSYALGPVVEIGSRVRMAVDAADHLWIAWAPDADTFTVSKLAP